MPGGCRPATLPNRFADAGMVLLRHQAHAEDEIWCRCDHGPHGYLSIAAHAHADALSIELRCGGVEVLVDPGTYTYQGEPEWRAYFRSTIGHNCLELAGQNQSVAGGPFMWLRAAAASEVETSGLDGGPKAVWRATHDGYRRLSPAARHERTVTLHRDTRRLVVEDAVESAGRHDCRLAFHIGPEVDCFLDGSLAAAQLADRRGRNGARSMRLPEALDVVRGSRPDGPAARMVFAMLRGQAADRDAGRQRRDRRRRAPDHGHPDRARSQAYASAGEIFRAALACS